MSRIAKNPVHIPEGVEVKVAGDLLTVKGKQGEIRQRFQSTLVEILVQEGALHFKPKKPGFKDSEANAGTLRALAADFVRGVSGGFKKNLKLVGVGYRAQVSGNSIDLALGFSHPVKYKLPDGVKAEAPTPTDLIISGFDKQKVGQVAAEIREYRPPEPYKGKGIRYADEHVSIKEVAKK